MTTQIGFRVACERCNPEVVGNHYLDAQAGGVPIGTAVQDTAGPWAPQYPACPRCEQEMKGEVEAAHRLFPLD